MLRVCAAAHRVNHASVASSMPSLCHLGSDIAELQNLSVSRLSLVQLPRLVCVAVAAAGAVTVDAQPPVHAASTRPGTAATVATAPRVHVGVAVGNQQRSLQRAAVVDAAHLRGHGQSRSSTKR